QVHPRAPAVCRAGRAAAGAGGDGADPPTRLHHQGAVAAALGRSQLRGLPPPDGSHRLRLRQLRRHRALADDGGRQGDRQQRQPAGDRRRRRLPRARPAGREAGRQPAGQGLRDEHHARLRAGPRRRRRCLTDHPPAQVLRFVPARPARLDPRHRPVRRIPVPPPAARGGDPVSRQSSFPRRTFFKSALAIPAVALPVLRSSPLLGATPDVRLVVFYSANGTIPETWKPVGSTDAWNFPAGGILEPLAKFKAKLNLLWGVHYKSGEKGPGAAHQKGIVACLTGLRAIQKDPGYATGISVDQWMANKWGAATRFKTVEFGVRNRTSGNRGCISYLGANQPVFPESDRVKAYARYFGSFTPAAPSGGPPKPDLAAERLLMRRKSALDFVRADLDRLTKRLPGDERVRLERHLESLRDLERQLAPSAGGGGADCKPMPPPAVAGDLGAKGDGDYQALSKLQIDNMFMALACGQSR